MTQQDLINKIMYLIPSAKVCVKDLSDNIGVTNTLSNYNIIWNSANISECPTQSQINAVDQTVANDNMDMIIKTSLIERLQNDTNILSNYSFIQTLNPNITLLDYVTTIANNMTGQL